MRNLLHD